MRARPTISRLALHFVALLPRSVAPCDSCEVTVALLFTYLGPFSFRFIVFRSLYGFLVRRYPRFLPRPSRFIQSSVALHHVSIRQAGLSLTIPVRLSRPF